jgi:hypothetical protein
VPLIQCICQYRRRERSKVWNEIRTQRERPNAILDSSSLVLIESQEDERVFPVDARVGEEGKEPVLEERRGEVDCGVVSVAN